MKNPQSRDRDPHDLQRNSLAMFCDSLGIQRSRKAMAHALVRIHRE